MKHNTFETQAYGKFILAGEHAVLRGCPALVFPVFSRQLRLMFNEGQGVRKETPAELEFVFSKALDRALELCGHKRTEVNGLFTVENSIPVGAGLGASAALCAVLGRFAEWKGWIKTTEVHEFSRQIENMFHGESSGVDVAVALSGQPLVFLRDQKPLIFVPTWKPKLCLSYSGERGMTETAIEKVKLLFTTDAALAASIDEEMRTSVTLAQAALSSNEKTRFDQLKNALAQAGRCFKKWGLTEGVLDSHMDWLKARGAAAVKPTGSGGGGYVLSLWKDLPANIDGLTEV